MLSRAANKFVTMYHFPFLAILLVAVSGTELGEDSKRQFDGELGRCFSYSLTDLQCLGFGLVGLLTTVLSSELALRKG
jgi:hypothetical protein